MQLIPGYDPWDTREGCTFDGKKADGAVWFIETFCRHVKGEWAGQPLKLQDWQKSIIGNLFGWHRADGTRRYREAFIFLPRKNSKTTLSAAIATYCLFKDNEPGAEIYCAAAEREQASLLFDIAKHMVLQDDVLKAQAKIYQKSIGIEATASWFRAISADAQTKHGFNSHCVIVDELHAQPNSELVDVLQTSLGSRRQPLLIYITTSDYERESICNQIHEYASQVRDGIVRNRAFLPVIYEASTSDDWHNEGTWYKANPNLGVSIKMDYFKSECQKAIDAPSRENLFKRLHLNIRTEQQTRWFNMDRWDTCAGTVDPAELEGKRCFAGLDLASTNDVTALALLFPDKSGYTVLPFFWIPEDKAREIEQKRRVPYSTWGRQGHVAVTPGNVVDYDVVRAAINHLGDKYKIQEIAVDRWNATQITTQLTGDGFEMVAYGQGFASMSAPSKELEKLILSGGLNHGGNPVLRWMASNASVLSDAAGNIKPDRKNREQKIDGIVAAVMALGRAMLQGEKKSCYETRGIRRL